MKISLPRQRIPLVIVILLIAAGLAVGVGRYIQPQRGLPVSVAAQPVSLISLPLTISRNGSVASAAVIAVTADAGGRISKLHVSEGQAVKAGQPLLTLQAVSGGPAPAGAAGTRQADYEKALSEFNRFQKLYEIGGISRQQQEQAAARLAAARERLNAADGEAGTPVQNGGSVTVTASAGGIVRALTVSAGDTVQTGQQLLTLGSAQDLEARIELSQNDLYLVHLGASAALTAAAQPLTGQVYKLEPQPAAANQPPQFLAYVKLAGQLPAGLKAGMPVTAKFETGQTAVVAAVPSMAVFRNEQGRAFIYLAVNGKAALQPVEPGESSGDFLEINLPLPSQSLVITSSIEELADGASIRVLP
ncbi:MAG: efflux RND transporter periplasmic adaptor subunit [Sporomusaceae bacterium]|nr:efflux RND transporter periplasmic adaptor subunit [Sporomusaceae bacterium]